MATTVQGDHGVPFELQLIPRSSTTLRGSLHLRSTVACVYRLRVSDPAMSILFSRSFGVLAPPPPLSTNDDRTAAATTKGPPSSSSSSSSFSAAASPISDTEKITVTISLRAAGANSSTATGGAQERASQDSTKQFFELTEAAGGEGADMMSTDPTTTTTTALAAGTAAAIPTTLRLRIQFLTNLSAEEFEIAARACQSKNRTQLDAFFKSHPNDISSHNVTLVTKSLPADVARSVSRASESMPSSTTHPHPPKVESRSSFGSAAASVASPNAASVPPPPPETNGAGIIKNEAIISRAESGSGSVLRPWLFGFVLGVAVGFAAQHFLTTAQGGRRGTSLVTEEVLVAAAITPNTS